MSKIKAVKNEKLGHITKAHQHITEAVRELRKTSTLKDRKWDNKLAPVLEVMVEVGMLLVALSKKAK